MTHVKQWKVTHEVTRDVTMKFLIQNNVNAVEVGHPTLIP